MSHILTQDISALDSMKKYPSVLFYKGNFDLLQRPKVSIVGTNDLQTTHDSFTYIDESLKRLSDGLRHLTFATS